MAFVMVLGRTAATLFIVRGLWGLQAMLKVDWVFPGLVQERRFWRWFMGFSLRRPGWPTLCIILSNPLGQPDPTILLRHRSGVML